MNVEEKLKEKSETTWVWDNDKQDYIPFTQSIKLSDAIQICNEAIKQAKIKEYEKLLDCHYDEYWHKIFRQELKRLEDK